MSTRYNTKSLQDRLDQTAPEDGGLGRAGLYRHPESGQEMHTLSDPLFGEAQSNAAVQLGFVRIRDSKPEEVKTVLDFNVAAKAVEADSLKGLSARMAQLEGVADRNKELEAEVEKLRKEALDRADATNLSGHDAKEAAAQKIVDRDQDGDSDPRKQVGDAPGTPPADPINSDLTDEEKAELENAGDRTHVRDEDPETQAKAAQAKQDEAEKLATEKRNQANARRHAELTDKPLEKDNFTATELAELAKLEDVDVDGLNSKQEFVDAIKASREAKESEN